MVSMPKSVPGAGPVGAPPAAATAGGVPDQAALMELIAPQPGEDPAAWQERVRAQLREMGVPMQVIDQIIKDGARAMAAGPAAAPAAPAAPPVEPPA